MRCQRHYLFLLATKERERRFSVVDQEGKVKFASNCRQVTRRSEYHPVIVSESKVAFYSGLRYAVEVWDLKRNEHRFVGPYANVERIIGVWNQHLVLQVRGSGVRLCSLEINTNQEGKEGRVINLQEARLHGDYLISCVDNLITLVNLKDSTRSRQVVNQEIRRECVPRGFLTPRGSCFVTARHLVCCETGEVSKNPETLKPSYSLDECRGVLGTPRGKQVAYNYFDGSSLELPKGEYVTCSGDDYFMVRTRRVVRYSTSTKELTTLFEVSQPITYLRVLGRDREKEKAVVTGLRSTLDLPTDLVGEVVKFVL